MTRKLLTLLIATGLSMGIVAGCGSTEDDAEKTDDTSTEPAEENVSEEETAGTEEDEEDEKEEVDSEESGSSNFSEMIEYMEETTEGTAEILYENNEQQTHESEDISVTLNGYTLVELKDFHTNYSIPFDDATDGGVILAEYTIENNRDEDAYYMTDFYVEYPGTQKFHSNNRDLLPEDVQLPNQLSHSNDYLIKAGETMTGYYAYSFGPDTLDKILELEEVTVNVNAPHSEKEDVTSNFGEESKFTLPLSGEGAEKTEANKVFYEDKATYDNMGDKKMLKEKADIGESEDLRDVTVTLDGYQFTEFTPNEVEAPRFSSFNNGVVLLTVKFLLDNNGDEDVEKISTPAKLTVNDGSQYLLNERMLLDYRNGDVVKAGESGELLQVFIMDQEQYEKIWKEKPFELEIGPLKNPESEDISKGHTITFTLPE